MVDKFKHVVFIRDKYGERFYKEFSFKYAAEKERDKYNREHNVRNGQVGSAFVKWVKVS